MAFEISDKLESILEMVDEFVKKELIPLEKDYYKKDFSEMEPILEEKREMVRQMELWAPLHPKEFGGMELPLMDSAMIYEILGRSSMGTYVFGCQAPDAGNVEIIHKFGTDEQKETYARPTVEGKIRSCFAMTEVEVCGSNPTWLLTTARKDGNDYVINGNKWYTTSCDGASYAVVMAETNPEASSNHLKASMILVPTDTPGFNMVRNISVMGHEGSGFPSHAEVLFQDCRVPRKNVLGGEGMGFVLSQERLGPGRIHHCMRWIGIMNHCFDLMCAHVKQRRRTPTKMLADSDVVKTMVAESAADILSSRLMVLNTAWVIQNRGVKDAMKDISIIKFHVANALQRVMDRALQLHGGLGMSDDTPISTFYRMERAARIYDGADEVHRISVGRRILNEY